MLAAKAYDLHNADLEGSGLATRAVDRMAASLVNSKGRFRRR